MSDTQPHHIERCSPQVSNERSQTSSAEIADDLPPPTPVPSSDPRLVAAAGGNKGEDAAEHNVLFEMAPVDALKMLSAGVERLVIMTGDIPPTPPPKSPTVPHMSGMQAEKAKIVRTHSDKNLARLRQLAEMEATKMSGQQSTPSNDAGRTDLQAYNATMSAHTVAQHKDSGSVDGVQLKRSAKPEPYIVVGADSQPVNLQHSAITRKFYSKNEPPITIGQYLLRLHQFCPMSTAVYLATSLYIHRLAVDERAIPVTKRNCHRLVLAGLRVAMKALEDLSYPHSKMSKVGGVTEAELARLEISFCFLTGFELVVDKQILSSHLKRLSDGTAHRAVDLAGFPNLRLDRGSPEVAQVAA